jgi:hypothetical protein
MSVSGVVLRELVYQPAFSIQQGDLGH